MLNKIRNFYIFSPDCATYYNIYIRKMLQTSLFKLCSKYPYECQMKVTKMKSSNFSEKILFRLCIEMIIESVKNKRNDYPIHRPYQRMEDIEKCNPVKVDVSQFIFSSPNINKNSGK